MTPHFIWSVHLYPILPTKVIYDVICDMISDVTMLLPPVTMCDILFYTINRKRNQKKKNKDNGLSRKERFMIY